MNQANQKSNVLRQVPIPLVSDKECINYNSQFYYTIDPVTQVCAGLANGKNGAYNGDSGSKLIIHFKFIH